MSCGRLHHKLCTSYGAHPSVYSSDRREYSQLSAYEKLGQYFNQKIHLLRKGMTDGVRPDFWGALAVWDWSTRSVTGSRRRTTVGRRPLPPKNITSVRTGEAVEAFLAMLATDPEVSKATVTAKAVIMRAVLDKFGADREVWTLTAGDLDALVTWLKTPASPEEIARRKAQGRYKARSGLKSEGSIKIARKTIQQFLEFCHRNQWLTRDVQLLDPIVKGKKGRRVNGESEDRPEGFERIPVERWPEILDLADKVHPRCRMAVALGLYCGRRVSEVVRIKWGWTDWENETMLFWNQKGEKGLTIALSPQMRAELERWRGWMIRAGYGEPQPDWYLVPNRIDSRFIFGINSRARLRNEPWLFPVVPTTQSATGTVWRDVRKVLNALGMKKGEGTHTFRRSSATAVTENAGLEATQELLGHAYITTTQPYAQNRKGARLLAQRLRDGTAFAPGKKDNADPPDTTNVLLFRRPA